MNMRLPIINRRFVAEDTLEITLGLGGTEFSFRPGQYVSLTLLDASPSDAKGNIREFSIASPPGEDMLSVAFRDSDSAFKRHLKSIPLGAEVFVEGPFGAFTLPRKTDRPLVFAAGGIGVTPFRSMIRHIHKEDLPHTIVLFYANTKSERAAYREEFQEIAASRDGVHFIEHIGPVTREALQRISKELVLPRYFIAGPPKMVAQLRQAMSEAGIEDDDVLFEEFTGYP